MSDAAMVQPRHVPRQAARRVLAALVFLALWAGGARAENATLTLSISGLQQTGKLFGQVFATAATFEARTGGVATFVLTPAAGTTLRTTLSLPPGRYAVAMFQDTKGTGKLETNFLGIPSVPYGFSNNAGSMMSPPSFEAASFEMGGAPLALSIELR